MPLMRCTRNGKLGWKFGKSGYCYIGATAKAKAQEQQRAMFAAGYRGDADDFIVNQIVRRRAMADKGNRKLGRPPRWLHPNTIEIQYRRALLRIVRNITEQTRSTLFPFLEGLVRERDETMGRTDSRVDGWADDADRLVGALKINIEATAPYTDPGTLAGDIGQKTANWNDNQWRKVMRTTVGVDVFQREPWLNDMVTSFSKENVALIKSIKDKAVTDIEGQVQRGLAQGQRHEAIRKQIQKQFKITRNRAKLIARDQVAKLNGQITQVRQTSFGVKEYTWRTSMDERVRPSHASKEGRKFRWDKPPSDTGHPGQDFQCVPGDSNINLLAGCEKLFRRWFDGELTEFITDSGISFGTTPNHPIFTNRDRIPANSVNIGDYVFEAIFNDSFSALNYINNNKVTIKEIFDFFELVGSMVRSTGFSSQFHGDGTTEHKVDIISTDSFLPSETDTVFDEKYRKFFLTVADETFANHGFSRNSNIFEFFNRALVSTDSIICSLSNIFSFIQRHTIKPDNISFASISDFYTKFVKMPSYNISANIEVDGYGKLTHAGQIKVFDFIRREFYSIIGSMFFSDTGINATNSEMLRKTIGINIECKPNAFKSGSFFYKPLRVQQKIVREFSGHVYNLQNKCSWYNINNGIVISNCRCTAEPVLDEVFKKINAANRMVV